MHPYHVFIAFSALACAVCSGVMIAQPGARRLGLAAPLALGALAYWGACQLFMQSHPTPEGATLWFRFSSLGWLAMGPLTLRIFMNSARVGGGSWLQVRRVADLTAMAGIAAVAFTPWAVEGARPTSWGYVLVPGPGFVLVSGITVLFAAVGVGLGRRAARRSSAEEARGQRWIAIALALPLSATVVTDVLAPLAQVDAPLLAPSLFGPMALVVVWLRLRLGYSPLSPAQVAGEVLEILPDGVALLGADGRIRLANGGLARLCEVPPDALLGRPLETLLRGKGDGDGESESQGELLVGGGQNVPVAFRTAVHRDRFGEPTGCVLVVRDLREVAQLRGQLVVSARLAAVGELAAGIAHEINNPLAFVRANLSQLDAHWQKLRPRLDSGREDPALRLVLEDCDELIGESLEGVDRAVEIVRGVRSFAHAGGAERELTELRPLIEDALRVASSQLRGGIDVLQEYDDDVPRVLASPQQMKQVFLNLVVNAAQAVGPDGTVLVATRSEGRSVIVSVADDGCGIPREHLERVFDPFFTTKPVGEGTGLGLGISHQIVTRHGGTIEVESEPGRGTIFRVRLPAAEAHACPG